MSIESMERNECNSGYTRGKSYPLAIIITHSRHTEVCVELCRIRKNFIYDLK